MGPLLTAGTSFSVRIPAPFPASRVTLWSPESRRCIPDILQAPTPSPRSPVQEPTPRTEARLHSGTPPCSSLRCFLKAKDSSRPEARTPGSLWTWCQQSFLGPRMETHTPRCAIWPFPGLEAHAAGGSSLCFLVSNHHPGEAWLADREAGEGGRCWDRSTCSR